MLRRGVGLLHVTVTVLPAALAALPTLLQSAALSQSALRRITVCFQCFWLFMPLFCWISNIILY